MNIENRLIERLLRLEGADSIERVKELFDTECYRLLKKIKEIIDDERVDDDECFWRIEEIVSAFEDFGIYCDGRHDF